MCAIPKTPRVSVIIPAYRQAAYLPDALDSLLAQTCADWEAIVVDDGSPDDVEAVIRPYLESDSRLRFYHTENRGVSAARNYALQQARGEFVLPLDADDKIAPSYIAKALAVFDTEPSTKLVYCRAIFFGEKNESWPVGYQGYASLLLWNSIFCSAFFRRTDAVSVGGYDETMRYGLEDWDFNIRLLSPESVVYQIPEELFFYRIKSVSRNIECSTPEVLPVVEEYIYNKHREKYLRAYGSELQNLREKSILRQRCDNFEREHAERVARKKRRKWWKRWHRES